MQRSTAGIAQAGQVASLLICGAWASNSGSRQQWLIIARSQSKAKAAPPLSSAALCLLAGAARYLHLAVPALFFTGLFEAFKRYLMAQVGDESSGFFMSPFPAVRCRAVLCHAVLCHATHGPAWLERKLLHGGRRGPSFGRP